MKHVPTGAFPGKVADFSGSEARPQKETSEHRQLDLSFVARQGQTLLDRRLFSYPYVLMRTFREPSGAVHLIVQNSSGPVHDRDDLATSLALNPSTNVRLTYQGATAIHRARLGNVSRERLTITLGDEAHLAYLPEARIYFPEAAHHQVTDIEIGQGSSLLHTDSFTTHDPMGAGRPPREFDTTLIMRRDREVVLFDRQRVASPTFPGGFGAFGTVLLIGLPEPHYPPIPNLYGATSALPSGLGWSIRLAAPDLRPIRACVASLMQRYDGTPSRGLSGQ